MVSFLPPTALSVVFFISALPYYCLPTYHSRFFCSTSWATVLVITIPISNRPITTPVDRLEAVIPSTSYISCPCYKNHFINLFNSVRGIHLTRWVLMNPVPTNISTIALKLRAIDIILIQNDWAWTYCYCIYLNLQLLVFSDEPMRWWI